MKYNFQTITLSITQGCNLRCPYCQVHKAPNTMSHETLVKALDWIRDNVEQPFVNFFGGEPLTEYESIKWAIENYPDIKFGMSTNVTLLNPERIKFFFDHKTAFLFSIDGIGEIHNLTRPDSWDKFAHLLPVLGELFPDAVFRITLTPDNIGELCRTVYLAHQLGFRHFHAMPDGMSENWKPEHYTEMRRQLTMIWNDPVLRKCFRTFSDYAWRLDKGGDEYQCCDGKTAISILWDGRFSLCGEQTENEAFIVGDLDNGIDQTKIDAFWVQVEPCPIHCKANPICSRERCFSRRMFNNGNLSDRIPNHCRWYNIIEEVMRDGQI